MTICFESYITFIFITCTTLAYETSASCRAGKEIRNSYRWFSCADNMTECDESGDGRQGCCCNKGFETDENDDCLPCMDPNINVTFVVPKKCLIAMAVGAGASVVSAPMVLASIGFTAAGITGGSLAATWQATMGTIGTGGIFATLQSAAMGGLSMTGSLTLAGAAGTSATAFCKAVDKLCGGCIGDI